MTTATIKITDEQREANAAWREYMEAFRLDSYSERAAVAQRRYVAASLRLRDAKS